jgi:hypothetical protein
MNMNIVLNPNRVFAVLAAVVVTLMQVALFAHSTTSIVA